MGLNEAPDSLRLVLGGGESAPNLLFYRWFLHTRDG